MKLQGPKSSILFGLLQRSSMGNSQAFCIFKILCEFFVSNQLPNFSLIFFSQRTPFGQSRFVILLLESSKSTGKSAFRCTFSRPAANHQSIKSPNRRDNLLTSTDCWPSAQNHTILVSVFPFSIFGSFN